MFQGIVVTRSAATSKTSMRKRGILTASWTENRLFMRTRRFLAALRYL